MDHFLAPLEVKFVESGVATGEFSGYAAVFGNMDSHGDVIMPGAFSDHLAERRAEGRKLPMHVMHGIFGGDGLPVGVWTKVEEDAKGLKVEGKISGMNTDAGRLLFERVKDGAMGGLSIGFRLRKGGVSYGQKPGEPKRTLKGVDLGEISIVDDPSNVLAHIQEVKLRKAADGGGGPGDPGDTEETAFAGPDVEDAIENIVEAIMVQDRIMQSGWGSSAKDQALVMDFLRSAHEALTGESSPDGLTGWSKSGMSIREIERILREECGRSHKQAREIAARRFAALPRDEGSKKAETAADTLADIGKTLGGFKLP